MTLPLFGAPLVVDINVDPGGNLVDVALNQPGDFTATTVKPNKVVFVNEVEGVSVKVKAKHGGERIEARAADLADVSGPGQWSGDIFENGQTTVVDFTVGARRRRVARTSPVSRSPHRSSSSSARSSTTRATSTAASTLGHRSRSSSPTPASRGRCLDHGRRCAPVRDHTSAKLSIGLSRIKGAEIPDGATVGAHSWSGMLCDGTNATIDYTVAEDGSITDVSRLT